MKTLLFLLLSTSFLRGQILETTETTTIDLTGRIHSVVTDQPENEFEFVVDNDENESIIYQYLRGEVIETYFFNDIVYHLYVVSKDKMYVTFERSDDLVVIDMQTKKTVKTVDKKYAVQHVDKNYLFVLTVHSDVATDKNYYSKTGTVVLDKTTLDEIPNTFLPATFIIEGKNDCLLLKEIVNWGKFNEVTKVATYNTRLLKKNPVIFSAAGNIHESNLALSVDKKLVSHVDGRTAWTYDIHELKLVSTHNMVRTFITNKFASADLRVTYEIDDHSQSYYVALYNLKTTYRDVYYVDDRMLNRGEIRMLVRKNFVILYSTSSNLLHRIDLTGKLEL